MKSSTSIPKASKRRESSSQSRKQKTLLRRIVTMLMTFERSKKKAFNLSPAQASIPVESPELAAELFNEPLNRVLLVDSNSHLVQYPMSGDVHHLWLEMNLIIAIDYGRNVFSVLKNRWGAETKNIPLDLLATFLYSPEVTNAIELNYLRIEHNNLFATRKSEQ